MKILHITNNYPSKNHPIFGIFVKEQIESLNRIDNSNDVFFINGRDKGKIEYLKSYLKLILSFKIFRYDIIHCHHSLSGIVFLATFLFPFKKCVISFQNPPLIESGKFTSKILVTFFNKVILKCKDDKIYGDKINVVPNGVNTNFFDSYSRNIAIEKLSLNPVKKYILFLDSNKGRTQKRKDRFDNVIQILKGFDSSITPIYLTNTIRELMPYYFNAASLHLITSDFEGSANSIKESLCCNTPVVSTPVGDANKILKGINSCFVSDGFSPQELAELCKVSLGESHCDGRSYIIENGLDIDSVAKKIYKIYQNI